MSTGEKYLFGAYAVLFAVVLVYVLIISLKLGRLERELSELAELAGAQKEQREAEAAERPVRVSGPGEGARGNREVAPRRGEAARG